MKNRANHRRKTFEDHMLALIGKVSIGVTAICFWLIVSGKFLSECVIVLCATYLVLGLAS